MAYPVLKEQLLPFTAGDGLPCHLIHVYGSEPPRKGPVLLVHGAGVRGNIFRPPTKRNFVEYLIDHGYDVWLENWRGSIDLKPNAWTLDQAALFDHPEAVKRVVAETGAQAIKAVIHCQGSTSFMMSVMAGWVPQVKTIVSNAVSLHPIVPRLSKFKLDYAVPLASLLTDHLNPQWGLHAPTLAAKIIALVVRIFHHECDNPVCKQVSFTYGAGFPALWRHENLNDETHAWITQEFGRVPLRFFDQIGRCVSRGHLISVEEGSPWPIDFVSASPKTDAQISFFAGAKNRCFLPQSQEETFAYFQKYRPGGQQTLHIIPGYSHLDIFLGKNADRDVFPLMLAELDQDHAT